MTLKRAGRLGVILSALLFLSIAYYWPIQEAYHPLNPDWNGCSKIADTSANRTLLFTYDRSLGHGSLLAIIAPATDFSKDESSNILNFLENGGTALLADDFGSGNSLLKKLNVSARFSGKPLADLFYYSKERRFPLVSNFSPDELTTNVTTILLENPSYIVIENSSKVKEIATSSPFSFVDLNGDDEPSANETIDSYPVIAKATIGTGSLVLISDPGMFLNEIVDFYDNMHFFQNLLKIGGGFLLIDTAHLEKAPLTDWRITLKNGMDLARDYALHSNNAIYLQFFIIGLVLVSSLSFTIMRVTKKQQPSK